MPRSASDPVGGSAHGPCSALLAFWSYVFREIGGGGVGFFMDLPSIRTCEGPRARWFYI